MRAIGACDMCVNRIVAGDRVRLCACRLGSGDASRFTLNASWFTALAIDQTRGRAGCVKILAALGLVCGCRRSLAGASGWYGDAVRSGGIGRIAVDAPLADGDQPAQPPRVRLVKLEPVLPGERERSALRMRHVRQSDCSR